MKLGDTGRSQSGDLCIQSGNGLFQRKVFRIFGGKREIVQFGYLVAVKRNDSVLYLKVVTLGYGSVARYRWNDPLQLHDKMQLHGIVGGIVAPIMPHPIEQIFLESFQCLVLHFTFYQGTNIDKCLGVTLILHIFVQGLIELLYGVFSRFAVKHTDTNIAGTYYAVVVVLSTGSGAKCRKIFPTSAPYAIPPRLENFVQRSHQ